MSTANMHIKLIAIWDYFRK